MTRLVTKRFRLLGSVGGVAILGGGGEFIGSYFTGVGCHAHACVGMGVLWRPEPSYVPDRHGHASGTSKQLRHFMRGHGTPLAATMNGHTQALVL